MREERNERRETRVNSHPNLLFLWDIPRANTSCPIGVINLLGSGIYTFKPGLFFTFKK